MVCASLACVHDHEYFSPGTSAREGALPRPVTEQIQLGGPSPWITITGDSPLADPGTHPSEESVAAHPRGVALDLLNMAIGILLAAICAFVLFVGLRSIEAWLVHRDWMPAPAGLLGVSLLGLAIACSMPVQQPTWAHSAALFLPIPLTAALLCWNRPRFGLAAIYVVVGALVITVPAVGDAVFSKSDMRVHSGSYWLGWGVWTTAEALELSLLLVLRRWLFRHPASDSPMPSA
jgi:hypothetical protein